MYEMKRFRIRPLKLALATCLVAISVTGFYWAGAPYLSPQVRRLRESGSVGLRANRDNQLRDVEGSVRPVLPEGWEAEWRGGGLWIMHRNPNGTVADFLLFDSVGSFHDWAAAHPDFCDLDVDKVAFSARETASGEDDTNK